MKKVRKYLVGLFIVISIVGCSAPTQESKITIGVTNWIGYSPLFYAREKGWLKKEGIELIQVSSLAENVQLFEHNFINIMAGTQYEYETLLEKYSSLKIIKLIDRSDGGDMILSNKSIEELEKSKLIHAYLEINSVNRLMLEDFMQHHNISKDRVQLHNKSQDTIDSEALSLETNSITIVTYIPYNFKHIEHGFKEIVSTKNNLEIFVIDGIMAKKETLKTYRFEIMQLKKYIDSAIEIANKNPKAYYDVVKGHLGISYEEFSESLSDIKWINKDRSNKLKTRLLKSGLTEY